MGRNARKVRIGSGVKKVGYRELRMGVGVGGCKDGGDIKNSGWGVE